MAFIPSYLWGTKYNRKSACGVQNTLGENNTVPDKSMCVLKGVCLSVCVLMGGERQHSYPFFNLSGYPDMIVLYDKLYLWVVHHIVMMITPDNPQIFVYW